MSANYPIFRSPIRSQELTEKKQTLYTCSKTGQTLGKVYQTPDGRWYLSTRYIRHWQPIEVFTKYNGFLFLNETHKRNFVQ